MRRLLNWFVLLPLAVVIVLFAVANRTWVTVSFDPFEGKESPLTLYVPLFIVIFAWWRDTEPESIETSHFCERPTVNVPVPGSGTTWSDAPSITSSTRSPNGA